MLYQGIKNLEILFVKQTIPYVQDKQQMTATVCITQQTQLSLGHKLRITVCNGTGYNARNNNSSNKNTKHTKSSTEGEILPLHCAVLLILQHRITSTVSCSLKQPVSKNCIIS